MDKLTLKASAIGSLPFKNPVEANNLIFETFTNIPMWAQLPNFTPFESMTLQYSQNLAGLVCKDGKYFFDCENDSFFEKVEELFLDYEEVINAENDLSDVSVLDKYAITKPYSHTFELFTEKLKQKKPPFAKGHITGAFTYSTGLCDTEGKCAYYDETLREVIAKTLTLKALWQIKEFKKADSDVTPIIFMDEPSISQLGSCAFLTVQSDEILSIINEISGCIKKFGAISAIHCCGKADWNLIAQSEVNMINFDAYFFSQNLSTCSDRIQNFIEKGGYLAWGVVPTMDKDALANADVNFLMKKFDEGVNYLVKKGLNEEKIIKQSIITPSCGAASLSTELAVKAMKMTKELSDELRRVRL